MVTNQVDTTSVHSSAAFRTLTSGSILRATSANIADLLKKKSVPRKQGKTKSRNKKKKDAEIVYVYNFGAKPQAGDGDDEEPGKQTFACELFRTRISPFLHFRATCSTSTLGPSPLVFRKGGIMSASVLDDEGKIIQTEKFSMDIETTNRNLRYEIEDFLSMSVVTEILEKNSGLIIFIAFTYSGISENEQPPIDSELGNKPDVKFSNDFKKFFLHEALNSQLGTRILDDFFEDGSIKVITKDATEFGIPIHRVLLAAQSPMLESLLQNPKSQVVIEEFEEHEVRSFVDYLYTGEVYASDISLLRSLIKLAEKFQIQSLREKCIRNILLTIARDAKAKSHKQLAIDYFRIGKQVKASQLMYQALDQYKKYKTKAGKKPKSLKLKSSNSSTVTLGDDAYEESRVLQSLEKLNSFPAVTEEVLKSSGAPDGHPLIAIFVGTSVSFLYKMPVDVFMNILSETPLETEFDEHGEKMYLKYCINCIPSSDRNRDRDKDYTTQKLRFSGELQVFKRKGFNDVSLRIEKFEVEYEGSPSREDLRSDCRIAFCRNAICDISGRRIHEAYCTGYTQEVDSSKVCESISFIPAKEFSKFKILSEQKDVILLTSMICRSGQVMNKTCSADKDTPGAAFPIQLQFSKNSLYQIVLEDFPSRIQAQLKKPAFSDAFIHMIDSEDRVTATFPVHRVLVSAFSELLRTVFKLYRSELYVPTEFFSVEAMEAMLQYVYGLIVPKMTLGLGLQLLTVCQDFDMSPRFKEYILYSLVNIDNWTFEFALIYYKYGHFLKESSVTEVAIECFKKNKDEFERITEFQQFLKTFPELVDCLKEDCIKKSGTEEVSAQETAPNPPAVEQVAEVETPKTITTESSEIQGDVERTRAVKERLAEYNLRRSEEHSKTLPVITPEMRRVINAIKNGTDSQPLAYSNKNMWTGDLRSLSYGASVNDKVVNEYFALINLRGDSPKHLPRVTAFPSVLYESIADGDKIKIKMDKGMHLLDYDFIFIPAKIDQNHWVLFAAFPKDRMIKCYDSTLVDRCSAMKLIREFFESEAVIGGRREDPDEDSWETDMPKNIPAQTEKCDCGVFICKYADYLLRRKRMVFNSSQMNYFRDMMIWEIHQQKLNP